MFDSNVKDFFGGFRMVISYDTQNVPYNTFAGSEISRDGSANNNKKVKVVIFMYRLNKQQLRFVPMPECIY